MLQWFIHYIKHPQNQYYNFHFFKIVHIKEKSAMESEMQSNSTSNI